MPTAVYPQHVHEYGRARQKRIRRLAERVFGAEKLEGRSSQGLLNMLQWRYRNNQLDSACFSNALEAADIGADEDYTPSPNQSTEALPGTHAKLAILAARVEAGQELWHEDDGGEIDD